MAYLSHNEQLIPDMPGGLFLEMLGNDSPHALQGSFQPDSQADRCLAASLQQTGSAGLQRRLPARSSTTTSASSTPRACACPCSPSRASKPPKLAHPPLPEYHSSLDTPAIVTQERLEASRRVVLGLLEAWERNHYVVNNFKGEIFCSGYGIWIDYRVNPEGHRRLFEIMERCDGEHTVADIAARAGHLLPGSLGGGLLAASPKSWSGSAGTPDPTDPTRTVTVSTCESI